jgi:serine protease Do
LWLVATVDVGTVVAAEPANSDVNLSLRDISRGWLNINSRSHASVKVAFKPVVHKARQSMVQILCNGSNTAFGTVVDAGGHAITKHSELHGNIECILSDRRRAPAKLVAANEDYDIALLQIDAAGLVPIEWSTEPVLTGAWLATVGSTDVPAAIGFASAKPRQIPAPRPVLGIELQSTSDGPLVTRVVPHSAAEKSNLWVGDVLRKINGKVMESPEDVRKAIRAMRTGDRVTMEVLRSGEPYEAHAVLGDEANLGNEQAEIMEELGGDLSDRRSGFPLAFEHDTVLRSPQCGGPLVDLTGKAVGINIARASRVASYAIPASAIQSLLPKLMADSRGAALLRNGAE